MHSNVEQKGIEKGIQLSEQKGLEKGMQIGEQKGIEKGLQLGEQKARLEIAVKLLESGKSLKFVKEMTELSEEELAKFPTDR